MFKELGQEVHLFSFWSKIHKYQLGGTLCRILIFSQKSEAFCNILKKLDKVLDEYSLELNFAKHLEDEANLSQLVYDYHEGQALGIKMYLQNKYGESEGAKAYDFVMSRGGCRVHFLRSLLHTASIVVEDTNDDNEKNHFINKSKKVFDCKTEQEAIERFNSIVAIWLGAKNWCDYFSTSHKINMLCDLQNKGTEPLNTNGIESSHALYKGNSPDELI